MYGVELYAAVRLAVVDEGLSHHEAGTSGGPRRSSVRASRVRPPSPRRARTWNRRPWSGRRSERTGRRRAWRRRVDTQPPVWLRGKARRSCHSRRTAGRRTASTGRHPGGPAAASCRRRGRSAAWRRGRGRRRAYRRPWPSRSAGVRPRGASPRSSRRRCAPARPAPCRSERRGRRRGARPVVAFTLVCPRPLRVPPRLTRRPEPRVVGAAGPVALLATGLAHGAVGRGRTRPAPRAQPGGAAFGDALPEPLAVTPASNVKISISHRSLPAEVGVGRRTSGRRGPAGGPGRRRLSPSASGRRTGPSTPPPSTGRRSS